jgi:histidine triad (HIT) family protein
VTPTAGSNDEDCLFCKILRGSIPSTKVAESEGAYAFRDINPAMPTHVLVIPRHHITNADTLTAEDAPHLSAVLQLAQQVARSEGLADEDKGYRLVFNVGPQSGNTVPHLHLHVLGGRSMGWPPG